MSDGGVDAARSRPVRPGPWADGVLDVEGHRGARGLVVENTLASFEAAIQAGVSGIELDVLLSSDGHLVVWHDPVLAATKCRSTSEDLIGARVDELTLAQLRTVDVGSQTLAQFATQRPAPGARISTLNEVIARVQELSPDVWWTIEVKLDPTDPRQVARREQLVEATLTAIHDGGVERRCFVHSFDWAALQTSEVLDPDVPRSALTTALHFTAGSPWTGSIAPEEHGEDVVSGAAALGASVIAPDVALVDASLVRRAHERGLAVLVWTANTEAELTRLHALGVDGIVTDYPDRARQVLGARS